MEKDAEGQFKVSVVIPCYNHGAFLDEAVDSVLAQTFQNFEIIVVNDGSTDEFTVNLLKNYAKSKTRVVHTTNQGLAAARNNGIKASSGEYICCLDSDDKYHPEFLAKTVKALEDDQEHRVGFVTTWVQQFGDDTTMWKPFDFDPNRLALMNVGHGCSLFRRECWDRIGGYSSEFKSGYEDWDFWLSLISAGYRWICVAEPLFYYRKKAHSMIQDADAKKVENVKLIFKRHRSFYLDNAEGILLKVMEVREDARKLFEEMSAFLAQRTAEVKQAYDGIEQMKRRMSAVIGDFERRLSEKDGQMAEQRAELNGRIEQMNQRMTALTVEFERRLSEKDRQMAEQVRVLDEKDRQMAEQVRVLDEKDRQLIERDQRIEALLRSLSWRITSPLRKIFGLFVSGRR